MDFLFLSFARPPPACSLLSAGLKCSPAPRAEGRAGGGDDDSVAGGNDDSGANMLIPCRSFAFRLIRYSPFIAWGGDVRRFPQLVLSLFHQGKAETMALPAIILSCGPSPVSSGGSSPLISSRAVAGRSGGVFRLSRLSACLVPRLVKSSPRCLSRLVPASRLMPSRRPSRSSSRPALPDVLLSSHADRLVLRSRRFAQLILSFSLCLVVLVFLISSSPHDRMMRDGHGYRLTPISRAGN